MADIDHETKSRDCRDHPASAVPIATSLRLARWRRFFVLLIALGVSACSVGPHLKMPLPKAPSSYTTGRAGSLGRAGPAHPAIIWTNHAKDVWWQMFRSPQLDGLIAASFRNSPTLAATRDALIAANEYAVAQEGAIFPTIGLGGGLQRNTSLRSIVGGRVVFRASPSPCHRQARRSATTPTCSV